MLFKPLLNSQVVFMVYVQNALGKQMAMRNFMLPHILDRVIKLNLLLKK